MVTRVSMIKPTRRMIFVEAMTNSASPNHLTAARFRPTQTTRDKAIQTPGLMVVFPVVSPVLVVWSFSGTGIWENPEDDPHKRSVQLTVLHEGGDGGVLDANQH